MGEGVAGRDRSSGNRPWPEWINPRLCRDSKYSLISLHELGILNTSNREDCGLKDGVLVLRQKLGFVDSPD